MVFVAERLRRKFVALVYAGSNPVEHPISLNSMEGFEYKNGELICKKCGSKNVFIRAGMMVDRAICNNCGNEDYI